MKYTVINISRPEDAPKIPEGVKVIGVDQTWKYYPDLYNVYFTRLDALMEFVAADVDKYGLPICARDLNTDASRNGRFHVLRSFIRYRKILYYEHEGDPTSVIANVMAGNEYVETQSFPDQKAKQQSAPVVKAKPPIVNRDIVSIQYVNHPNQFKNRPELKIGHAKANVSDEEYRNNRIDVLVVNLNNIKYTIDCVKDILEQDWTDYSITVYDNASDERGTSDGIEHISKMSEKVRVVKLDSMMDLNKIWNKFAAGSTAKYLCFLNNDVRIPKNFLRDTVITMSSNQQIGIVSHATNNKKYCTVKNSTEYCLSESSVKGKEIRQGWDFSIRRELYVPIPDDIRVYCGDDWIFHNVYGKGKLCAIVTSSPIIHYGGMSRRSRKVSPDSDIAGARSHMGMIEFDINTEYSSLSTEFNDFKYEAEPVKAGVAVLIQLYWLDLWPEFEQYLSNITCPYDLYVGLVCGSTSNAVLIKTAERIRGFKPGASVIFVENRGLDIGNAFIQMKTILLSGKKYDYYLKMHGKKSLDTREKNEGHGLGEQWRKELILPICGSQHAVHNCLNMLKLASIGMVGSKKWYRNASQDSSALMRHGEIINYYISKFKFTGLSQQDCEFIGGTMFWVRGGIWEDFFSKMNIDNEYSFFERGKYNDMGRTTYAHSMERVFGLVVKNAKLKLQGI